ASDFLSRRAKQLSAEQRNTLLREVLRLLADARFALLFTPGSRAEVSIGGQVATADGKTVLVSGQVDRLVVTRDAVLIADFKTKGAPPAEIDRAPSDYIRQLALYRAVLMKLYPDRPVHAALIWTEVPDLMELSGDLLDRALADHVAARAP